MNINDRLTIEEYGCMLSLVGKGRSEDHFTHVSGVAISKDKRILGIAYNGLKAGMEVPAWMTLEENRERKNDFYLHAEQNLFSLVERGECHLLCLNLSPCINCCHTIAANEVKRVVYHRCNKFKPLFEFYGIECYELSAASKLKISNYLTNQNNFAELK